MAEEKQSDEGEGKKYEQEAVGGAVTMNGPAPEEDETGRDNVVPFLDAFSNVEGAHGLQSELAK